MPHVFPLVVAAFVVNMIILGVYNVIRRRLCPQRLVQPLPPKVAPPSPERLSKLQKFLKGCEQVSIQDLCGAECTICLEAFDMDGPCGTPRVNGNLPASRLPCGHVFHAVCLERWVIHRPQEP